MKSKSSKKHLLLAQNGAQMDATGHVPKIMSNEDLDGAVENFLDENFSIEVDFFDVDEALELVAAPAGANNMPSPTAEQDATRNSYPLLQSGARAIMLVLNVPLDEALRAMDEKWDNFFQYNLDD